MKKKIIFTLGILIIVFIFTISTYFKSETNNTVSNIINSNDNEIKLLKDGTKYLVHPDKIRSGGPPKDGIPSIDNPKFVTVKNADEWIQYIKRTITNKKSNTSTTSFENLMKYGLSYNYWNEYIFQAYVNHISNAIYLEGLPDMSSTRPHSTDDPVFQSILPDTTTFR